MAQASSIGSIGGRAGRTITPVVKRLTPATSGDDPGTQEALAAKHISDLALGLKVLCLTNIVRLPPALDIAAAERFTGSRGRL